MRQVQEAYIVAATRTPIGRSGRGYFRNTRPDDLLIAAIKSVMKQVPALDAGAIENRRLGYLQWSDVIVAHKDELLHVATQQVKAMSESGWRPPARTTFPVAGRNAIATIKAQLVNMRDGGFISAHDFHIASLIADVVCGGEVEAGSLVNEEYLMALERKHFCGLLDHPKTQERIMGMLQTGKPVRN